jgi:hydrogenase small subunit
MMALPPQFTSRVARALQSVERPGLLWLEFQDCAGNTESFLRSHDPSVADIVLDLLSVDYHETIMSAAGHQAEAAKASTIEKGGYIVVVEGSVPVKDGGVYCTIAGKTARQHLEEAAAGAIAIVNVGTCSSYGGIPAASPNPTGAKGVPSLVSGVPVINLPGCPMNADNLTATLVHFLTFGALPATDSEGRPLFAYGERIHDHCERRAHFDAGQFALEWGDDGHRSGWCLYKLGCKGPSTFHNCPSVRWNGGTSWPIGAGHGCVGCSEPGFWDTMSPFYGRLPNLPPFGTDTSADKIGVGIVGLTAAGFAAHGVGKVIQHRAKSRRLAAEESEPVAEAADSAYDDEGGES